jgi:hypothetical protein
LYELFLVSGEISLHESGSKGAAAAGKKDKGKLVNESSGEKVSRRVKQSTQKVRGVFQSILSGEKHNRAMNVSRRFSGFRRCFSLFFLPLPLFFLTAAFSQ